MTPFQTQAKSLAGAAFKHLRNGRFGHAMTALATGKKGDRRAGMAALILAANITPEEQAALRNWLDERPVA